MFQATLKQIVSDVEGALGAAVMSLEGVVLAAVNERGEATPEAAELADYAAVLNQLMNVSEAGEIGRPAHFTIQSADRAVLVRMIGLRYCAALVVSAESILGKARFQLQIAAPDLACEL